MMDDWAIKPAAEQNSAADSGRQSGDSLSMHADVPVWCDCCSCEAEPYWVEALGKPDDDEAPES
ncbi:MAG: hypothetical protein HKP57_03485 [Halobacteria archaeon]|nr:hypothetical protein [Halobacteria archaeon]